MSVSAVLGSFPWTAKKECLRAAAIGTCNKDPSGDGTYLV